MHNIFISHRHDDQHIAKTIREHLLFWGVPSTSVFQSSSVSSGVQAGATIKSDLHRKLFEAKLVILVYTFPDNDWSYCMWECGVANGLGASESRIVVFQCTDHSPQVFADQLAVTIKQDSIDKFVFQFHKEEGFFPGQPALMPEIADQALDMRSRALFEDIKSALPDEGLSRWQYFEEMIRAHSIFGSPDTSSCRYDVFMLMPFKPELSPVYEDHIKKCAAKLNLSCGRADDFFSANAIIKDVWSGICNASVVIADCTDRNPNVFYEIGISHTLDKKTILVAQSIDDVPFDLRHLRVIEYEYTPRGMTVFEQSLERAIRAVFSQKIKNA